MLSRTIKSIAARLRKKSPYTPLIEVRIHRENILHNYAQFQARVPHLATAPILKSNAYGHGLSQIAQILETGRPPFMCVDSLYEANILRGSEIQTPLLVIGYTPLQNISPRSKNIAYSIISIESLREIAANLKHRATFHLKLDTGMHRHGITPQYVDEAIRLARSNPNITIEGVFSHLADADGVKGEKTLSQISVWSESVRQLEQALPEIHWKHLSNTAGSAYAENVTANAMRLGIGLYGIYPKSEADQRSTDAAASLNLKPALEMKTAITSLRTVLAGEAVGYNDTFRAQKQTVIASIPVGYFEGLDRRLSNKGCILVRSVPCPIVGRVSMNICSIDVSGVPDARVGDEVTVISKDPKAPNSIEGIARTCETIPYEILIHIPAHLRRAVV